jgi:hypothetical protein
VARAGAIALIVDFAQIRGASECRKEAADRLADLSRFRVDDPGCFFSRFGPSTGNLRINLGAGLLPN